MRAWNGLVTSSVVWDGQNPKPKLKQTLKTKGVEANSFLSSLSPEYGGIFHGKLDTEFEFVSEGADVQDWKQTLTGKGRYLLTDGEFTTVRFSKKPLDSLRKNPLLAQFITKTEWQERVNNLNGSFRIENGKVSLDNFVLHSNLFDLVSTAATIDFDQNIAARLAWFPKEGVISQDLFDALRDENGVASIPLFMTGSMRSPNLAPDYAVLEPRLKTYAQRRLAQEADKLKALLRK
jgi:hypothetical protein